MASEPSDGSGETGEVEPPRRTETKRLPTVTALLVAAVAVVGVTVAGLSLAGAGTVAADEPAGLETSVVTVSENGTTEIGVRTDGTDAFEIVIGDEQEVGYVLRATVTPNDDGVTTLVFDHAETGGGGTPLTAEGDATVDIDRETTLNEPIAPGEYGIELRFDGGDVDAVGTVIVEERDTAEDGDEESGSDPNEGGRTDDGEESEKSESDRSAEPTTVTEADVEEADLVVEPGETDVSVSVPLDDGETVDLRIRSDTDASTGFIMTEETTVENGSASATFELSPASHGDRATLTVRGKERLDKEVTREVLVVDESIGVGQSGNASVGESPGFGIVAGALALLLVTAVVQRRT
ncbi:BGTF surface domain-containing protein [Halorubrum sp. RMP-47]|uniref:BGTF surface domain-containing protein n=1 Tax=Halorubrum miltondacostae TaxID=3076378 RepID=A0ABD5M5C9_9EURY